MESTETAADNSSVSWLSPTLLYGTLLLGLYMLVKSLLKSVEAPGNVPPCPVKPYPVVGHIPYARHGMRNVMNQWMRSGAVGELYSLYFGSTHMVILTTYDAAYQAFVKNADTMSDRPASMKMNNLNDNAGIVFSSGPSWKEQRTISLQILRAFGMGKNILARKVEEEVSAYLDEIAKNGEQPQDVAVLTNTAVSNVIASILVGKRFEYDDAYYLGLLEIFDHQARIAATTNLSSFFKCLRYIPGDPFKSKVRLENARLLINTYCARFVEQVEKDYDENNLDNFIATYLFEMKKAEKQGKGTSYLDRTNLIRDVYHLFIAGAETTSTTILWFLLYMIHFPQVQEKIYGEIVKVAGTERTPTMQDRTKLHYANAAISETQRLASIVTVGLPHTCSADTEIKGYTIPAGASVIVDFDAVLHSSKTYQDSLEFRPERFLDADGNYFQPDEFMPFSLGRRACLGEALARTELFLFATTTIQRFKLLPAEDGKLPPRHPVNGITSPPASYSLRFLERRNH